MVTLRRVLKGGFARVSRLTKLAKTKAGMKGCYCNACKQDVAGFYRYGGRPWGCPLCGSSTRERFVVHAIDTELLPLDQNVHSLLHVAPSEKAIIERFGKITDYHPVDLFPDLYPAADTKRMDLMELDEQHRYDVVYLSHVMEHVPDDIAVYQNLYNSLKPGGMAWILVPLWDKPSKEGGQTMTAREREKHFGQWDHVRQYGPDLQERMAQVGFQVSILKAGEIPAGEMRRLGLDAGDWIFLGRK